MKNEQTDACSVFWWAVCLTSKAAANVAPRLHKPQNIFWAHMKWDIHFNALQLVDKLINQLAEN